MQVIKEGNEHRTINTGYNTLTKNLRFQKFFLKILRSVIEKKLLLRFTKRWWKTWRQSVSIVARDPSPTIPPSIPEKYYLSHCAKTSSWDPRYQGDLQLQLCLGLPWDPRTKFWLNLRDIFWRASHTLRIQKSGPSNNLFNTLNNIFL